MNQQAQPPTEPQHPLPPAGLFEGVDLDKNLQVDAAEVTFQDGTKAVGRHYRVPTLNPGISLNTVVTDVHVDAQEYNPARIIEQQNAAWQKRYNDVVDEGRRLIKSAEDDRQVAAAAAIDARNEEVAAKKCTKKAEEETNAMKIKFWVSLAGGILLLIVYGKALLIDGPTIEHRTQAVRYIDEDAMEAAKAEAVAAAKKEWRRNAGRWLTSVAPVLDDPTRTEDDYSHGRRALGLDDD